MNRSRGRSERLQWRSLNDASHPFGESTSTLITGDAHRGRNIECWMFSHFLITSCCSGSTRVLFPVRPHPDSIIKLAHRVLVSQIRFTLCGGCCSEVDHFHGRTAGAGCPDPTTRDQSSTSPRLVNKLGFFVNQVKQ